VNKSESMINSFGVGLILLGILRLTGIVKFENAFLFCATLSALLFTLGDFIDNVKKPKWKMLSIFFDSTLYYSIAITSIIVYPHFPGLKKASAEKFSQFNDAATLLALGLVVVLVAWKSVADNNKTKENLIEYKSIVQDYRNRFEELKKTHQEIVDNLSKQIELYRERIKICEDKIKIMEQLLKEKEQNYKEEQKLLKMTEK
jgi:hypothetical protein